jgi:hypothetical protein
LDVGPGGRRTSGIFTRTRHSGFLQRPTGLAAESAAEGSQVQNPQNKREILVDEKLEPIFGGKKVTMFEMNKHLARHPS